MSIQEQYDNYLKNLNYQIQAESVGLNTWGDIKRRLPSKAFIRPSLDELLSDKKGETVNKQRIRQEQISAYLEKENAPVVINGTSYKYNQAPEPTLDDPTPVKQQYSQDMMELQKKSKSIQDIKNSIYTTKNKIEFYKNGIDELNQFYDFIVDSAINGTIFDTNTINSSKINDTYKSILKQAFKPDGSDTNEGIIAMIPEISKEIDEKNKELTILQKQHATLEKYLSDTDKELDILKEQLNISQAEINNIIQTNKNKTNTYKNQLISLNTGRFSTTRDPLETDEEYLQRLATNAQIPYDNSTTGALSDIERNNAFKDNLRTLVSNSSYVEQVLNYFRSNGSETHYMNEVNKYFGKFKKTFENIYGIDNSEVIKNPQMMIDFIINFVQSDPSNVSNYEPSDNFSMMSSSTLTKPNPNKNKAIRDYTIDERREEFEDILNKNKSVTIGISPDRKIAQFKKINTSVSTSTSTMSSSPEILRFMKFYIHDKSIRSKPKSKKVTVDDLVEASKDKNGKIENVNFSGPMYNPLVLISPTGIKGSWRSLSNVGKSENGSIYGFLKNMLNISIDQFRKIFNTFNNGSHPDIEDDDLIEFLTDIIGIQPSENFDTEDIYVISVSKEEGIPYVGSGISSNIENTINFGKVLLSYKKLILKNLLSIQQKNGNKVPGFNNKVVSDEFVTVINKLINKENILDKDIDMLKIGENALLDKLLSVAQIHFKRSGAGMASVKKAKENLEVVKGQILSGNNNPAMKKDLYHALFSLVHLGAIGEKQARQHYKEIVDNYF